MRTLIAFAALVFAAACTHPTDRANARTFGAAVETMHDAQQRTSATPSSAEPEGSAAVGTLAQTRYKTGQTRALLAPNTSIANPSTP